MCLLSSFCNMNLGTFRKTFSDFTNDKVPLFSDEHIFCYTEWQYNLQRIMEEFLYFESLSEKCEDKKKFSFIFSKNLWNFGSSSSSSIILFVNILWLVWLVESYIVNMFENHSKSSLSKKLHKQTKERNGFVCKSALKRERT